MSTIEVKGVTEPYRMLTPPEFGYGCAQTMHRAHPPQALRGLDQRRRGHFDASARDQAREGAAMFPARASSGRTGRARRRPRRLRTGCAFSEVDGEGCASRPEMGGSSRAVEKAFKTSVCALLERQAGEIARRGPTIRLHPAGLDLARSLAFRTRWSKKLTKARPTTREPQRALEGAPRSQAAVLSKPARALRRVRRGRLRSVRCST